MSITPFQLFTIHIMKYNQVFFMIYALLLTSNNNQILTLLKDAVLNFGLIPWSYFPYVQLQVS